MTGYQREKNLTAPVRVWLDLRPIARAVMEELRSGQANASMCAAKYNIRKDTIFMWATRGVKVGRDEIIPPISKLPTPPKGPGRIEVHMEIILKKQLIAAARKNRVSVGAYVRAAIKKAIDS